MLDLSLGWLDSDKLLSHWHTRIYTRIFFNSHSRRARLLYIDSTSRIVQRTTYSLRSYTIIIISCNCIHALASRRHFTYTYCSPSCPLPGWYSCEGEICLAGMGICVPVFFPLVIHRWYGCRSGCRRRCQVTWISMFLISISLTSHPIPWSCTPTNVIRLISNVSRRHQHESTEKHASITWSVVASIGVIKKIASSILSWAAKLECLGIEPRTFSRHANNANETPYR